MTATLIFGSRESSVSYTERLAAYVVINVDGKVAMVRAREKLFLPGGGSLASETPVETIEREVREELARSVRLIRSLGTAIQYFYSVDDDRHYRMVASFFAGEFAESLGDTPEHKLQWLHAEEAEQECFHACHAWAVKLCATKDALEREPAR